MVLAIRKSDPNQSSDLLASMMGSLHQSKKFIPINIDNPSGLSMSMRQLQSLRIWHYGRMRVTHHKLLNQAGYQEAAEFLLRDVYAGFNTDISKVACQIERALPVAVKIFPSSVLQTASTALELNVITHEIDEMLSSHLFSESCTNVCVDKYMRAYLDADIHSFRVKQIDLSIQLASAVDEYLNKRWLLQAFKLARLPAKKAGIMDLYEFLARAFSVLANIPDLKSVVYDIARLEHVLSQELANGMNPFAEKTYQEMVTFPDQISTSVLQSF